MNRIHASVLMVSLALATGCSSTTSDEPASSSNQAIVGVLTSPVDLDDEKLVGHWIPFEAEQFRGEAKSITLTKAAGVRGYRLGDSCAAPCSPTGNWFVSDNPVVWFFAGSYIVFHTGSDPNYEKSLFIWRKPDGEIRLVDLETWDWTTLSYRNTYRRDPALTSNDL